MNRIESSPAMLSWVHLTGFTLQISCNSTTCMLINVSSRLIDLVPLEVDIKWTNNNKPKSIWTATTAGIIILRLAFVKLSKQASKRVVNNPKTGLICCSWFISYHHNDIWRHITALAGRLAGFSRQNGIEKKELRSKQKKKKNQKSLWNKRLQFSQEIKSMLLTEPGIK